VQTGELKHFDIMQYYHSRLLFIAILCLFILIDETNSLRVRVPSIRLSATFSKTAASIKKKLYLDDSDVVTQDGSSTLNIRPLEKNDDL